jgi:hypothetical protein
MQILGFTQYHYIAFYECVYYHESEEVNTLQTKRSDNSTWFVHEVPTSFYIPYYVVEIGTWWIWGWQDRGGKGCLQTTTCLKHYIVLISSTSFSSASFS